MMYANERKAFQFTRRSENRPYISRHTNFSWFNVLAANDSIENLDLSWNQIRRRGAMAVAAGLKVHMERLVVLLK